MVDSLLAAIFRGQLREGQWLNTQKLAAQLGVSGTPVREALVELATIGLVEMQHNLGTVTRRFGPLELEEIYHLRAVLEAEAARCACGRILPADLEPLKAEMTALLRARGSAWSERAIAADRALHALVARHCGSRRLTEEISRYNTLVQSLREVVGNRSHAQEKGLREHLEIVKALLQKQPARAAQAMRKHVLSTAESVRQALFPDAEGQPASASSRTKEPA